MAEFWTLGIMRAFITKVFLTEPRLRGAGYRYGGLAFILALLILNALLCPHLPPSYPGGRWFPLIVPLMLLLNHLAFQFRWSQLVTVFLRVIAYAWLIFGMVYILSVVFTRW